MRLLWREMEDTLSQLRARDRPAGFSLRKDPHLLSPLIPSPQKNDVNVNFQSELWSLGLDNWYSL